MKLLIQQDYGRNLTSLNHQFVRSVNLYPHKKTITGLRKEFYILTLSICKSIIFTQETEKYSENEMGFTYRTKQQFW